MSAFLGDTVSSIVDDTFVRAKGNLKISFLTFLLIYYKRILTETEQALSPILEINLSSELLVHLKMFVSQWQLLLQQWHNLSNKSANDWIVEFHYKILFQT